MADRIRFAVVATPIETITDENSGSHDILASEVGKVLSGQGESLALSNYSGSAAAQGYANATVNYLEAIDTGEGTSIGNAGNDFIFIKNTGYRFSSTTVLGASTTECVLVAIRLVAYENAVDAGFVESDGTPNPHFIEIAWLQPGQGIVLPLGVNNKNITRFGNATNDLSSLCEAAQTGATQLYVKTFAADGSAGTGHNAVEFLAVT